MAIGKFSVNLILTFKEIEQEIYTTSFSRTLSEEEFIEKILIHCGKDAHQLEKISCCIYEDKNEPFKCEQLITDILARNGKYYFNTDVNKDEDTQEWSDFRDDVVENMNYEE